MFCFTEGLLEPIFPHSIHVNTSRNHVFMAVLSIINYINTATKHIAKTINYTCPDS